MRKMPCEIISINKPAIKKRVIQITKGCATCKPNLVATAAEGQSIENPIPITNHSQPADFLLFNALIFWLTKVVLVWESVKRKGMEEENVAGGRRYEVGC